MCVSYRKCFVLKCGTVGSSPSEAANSEVRSLRSELRGLASCTFLAKEILKNNSTFVLKNAACNLATMVQCRIVQFCIEPSLPDYKRRSSKRMCCYSSGFLSQETCRKRVL